MKRGRQEPMPDKIPRYRIAVLSVSASLILISLVLFVMPRIPDRPLLSDGSNDVPGNRKILPDDKMPMAGSKNYVVIFDAGSSGTRVHVYCFDNSLNLLPIGQNLELFRQRQPGLSAYANDPLEAAKSLEPLLIEAESVVPSFLHNKTPVKVGATAGLRALEGDTSVRILEAVKDFINMKSTLQFQADWVSVLDGTQEGAYQWVTTNHLLGNLGKSYMETVGIVDLGGGSVQMAYGISGKDALKAPKPTVGVDSYVKELFLKGIKYHLYVHSYLHYGLLAARAEILKVGEGFGNPCILNGHHGSYSYGGSVFEASSSGCSFTACRALAIKALRVNESTCTHAKCTFGGVWNGGGGDGQRNLFIASFFFDRAAETGLVDVKHPVSMVKPADFEDAARHACEVSIGSGKAVYPLVEEENLPYLCMDLVYQYTLLVDGFALNPWQEITLVKKVKYGKYLVEAAWPLGSAIEAVSLSSNVI